MWQAPRSEPSREATYYMFHDESIPNKRWLLIGLVLVEEGNLSKAREVLTRCREIEGYRGEIHFSELPKTFNGKWNAKARIAKRWLEAFESELKEFVFFSALAVDRFSPKFSTERFKRDFHVYNRFSAMAIKAAISWHLGLMNMNKLNLHIVSDEKGRTSRPDRGMIDNFEDYIPYRVELDAFLKKFENSKYPLVRVELELRDSCTEELLQFCDVLLGATQEAMIAGSDRQTKRELGLMVVKWCFDLKKPVQEQIYKLYRKFNFWAFPNDEGKPYTDVPLALAEDFK